MICNEHNIGGLVTQHGSKKRWRKKCTVCGKWLTVIEDDDIDYDGSHDIKVLKSDAECVITLAE